MRVRAIVSGRVQGVGFRWSTVRSAERLGVTGSVRNLADGRVEAIVEGTDENVAAMLDWLGHGPAHAEVTGVEVHELPSEAEASGFRIV